MKYVFLIILFLFQIKIAKAISESQFNTNATNTLVGVLLFTEDDRLFVYVKALLKQGADPNYLYQDGSTPFLRAILIGDLKLVKLFIEHKADPEKLSISIRGQSIFPLMVAIRNGYSDIMKYLVEEMKVDVNQVDHRGITPLMEVVMHHHYAKSNYTKVDYKYFEMIKFLIKHDADPYIKNKFGTSAFDLARQNLLQEVLEVFGKNPLGV